MRAKIGYKLAAAVVGVTIVIIGVFAYIMLQSHERQLLAELERAAHQLSETIKNSTYHDMLLNQRESVHEIIRTIGSEEGIEKVRIFNKGGEVILSTDSLDLNQMVDKRAEACYVCHAADQPLEKAPVRERTRIFTAASGARILGIVNPIYNESACWEASCHAHGRDQKVLGVLDITMSTEEVERSIQAGQVRLAVFALIAVVAISLMIYWLVNSLVLTPIGRIVEGTERVAAGDLSQPVELGTDDEIGQLALSFNDMMEQVARAQNDLIQSNKLSSVGRLAAEVAHEINNPLTGVLTYSSFLLSRAEDQPELKDDLEVIVRETKRCRDIVKGLLDFSRQSTSEKHPTKVGEIVRNACRIVQNQLSLQNTKLDLQLQENLPSIYADMNQIEQVMVNLLVNAADAMPEGGGTVTVETELVKVAAGKYAPGAHGHWIRIRVTDTGCGIPVDRLDKIMEPFYTTKAGKGTGLGLAIAWGIVEEHRGQLQVKSEVGKGTMFSVLLPLAEPGNAH
jgi:two-component system NtrC family sensor kinase